MSFSDIIKELRRQHDMTQDELADTLGITSQAVSRWERGISIPDIDTIVKLAYLFNVTTDFLLGVDGAKTEVKIEEIVFSVRELPVDEAIAVLRGELNRYPCHMTLMNCLAGYLSRGEY